MAPPSLVEMCVNVAVANIKYIDDFGNMPMINGFRDILRAVKNARQLHAIEQRSEDPDIYQFTEEHWKRIINQDFPQLSRQHNWTPDQPKNWFRVWDRYNEMKQAADAEAIANLEAAVEANKKKVEMSKAKILDAYELPPPPRKTSHWSSQPRPKPANGSFIQKARNEARKETTRFRLTTATGQLPVKPGQITHAPTSMLEQKRREQQFDPATAPAPRTHIRVPRGPRPAGTSTPENIRALIAKREQERKEKEERLLRIKSGGLKRKADDDIPPPSAVLTFSDDDDTGSEVISNKNTTTTKMVTKRDASSAPTKFRKINSPSSSPKDVTKKSASPTNAHVVEKDSQSDKSIDDLFGDDPSPVTTPTKKKGTLSLADIMALEAGQKTSSVTPKTPSGGSPATKAPNGSLAKPLPSVANPSVLGKRSLSSMSKDEAEKLEVGLRTTVEGPSAAGPRRIIKRPRKADHFLLPMKRPRKN